MGGTFGVSSWGEKRERRGMKREDDDANP